MTPGAVFFFNNYKSAGKSLTNPTTQVISRALSVWGLELVPRDSSDPVAVRAKSSPIAANAYICNYRFLHAPLPLLPLFYLTDWSQGTLVCDQETWKSVVQSQLATRGS